MKLLYITSTLPYGPGEAFLIPEIREFLRQGHQILVIPLSPRGRIVHRDVVPFMQHIAVEKLISLPVLIGAISEMLRHPLHVIAAFRVLLGSRNYRIFLKNIAVLPKALWLAQLAQRFGAEHIHAHWGGCSSTLAMVASRVSGIPWSFTVHSWELIENNLLRAKAESASFTRVISRFGEMRLRCHVGVKPAIHVIHLGVDLPVCRRLHSFDPSRNLHLLFVGSLIPIKGFSSLIEAWNLLFRRGIQVTVDVLGSGPLRGELEEQSSRLGATGLIKFHGLVPHDTLTSDIGAGRWDAIVLPSIVAENGQQEGIPMCLVDAMAHGLPVIATETGGIPELLRDGAGIMVPPNDSVALADAIQRLWSIPQLSRSLGIKGRRRIEEEFEISYIVRTVVQHIANNERKAPMQCGLPTGVCATALHEPVHTNEM